MSVSANPQIISLLITFLVLPVFAFAKDHFQFTICRQPFQCGNISGIGYPFWGANRPNYCGFPGFNLTCNAQVASIMIDQLSYQVLQINNLVNTIKVARTDYTQTICPEVLRNTTMVPSLFKYTEDTQNVTIYYGCPLSEIQHRSVYQFNCNRSQGYFLTGDPTSTLGSDVAIFLTQCDANVTVPANHSVIQSMNGTMNNNIASSAYLVANLNQGFGVEWSANNSMCTNCTLSGGQCGYNQSTRSFACYCPDQPYNSICPSGDEFQGPAATPRGIGTGIKIAIGVVVGVIFCIGICSFFFCTRVCKAMTIWRRKTKPDENSDLFIMNYQSIVPQRYLYSDIKKITNSFADKLGQGGFGSVYKGKLADGRLVAVKVLKKSKGDREEFINEVASTGRASHVNVVTLLGFCYEGTKRALIYEYMPNGSLDKFIYHQKSPNTGRLLEWKTLFEIVIGIARGLEYLHRGCNTRIVHFDIKPHNILLDQDFCPKISDFGLAKLCKGKESKVSMLGARGTAGYIAPEVFCRNFGGVSYKSDVYSYGMMVLEMVGGKQNVNIGASESSEVYFPDWIYKQLEPGEISRFHGGITEEEEETIKKMILVGLWCIQTNPCDRPSMTKVVEMLEGSLESLQVPPKPFLSSPERPPLEFSSISSSQMYSFSRKDEEQALSLDKNEL